MKSLLIIAIFIYSSAAVVSGQCRDRYPVVCAKYWVENCGHPSISNVFCRFTCNKCQVASPVRQRPLGASAKASFQDDSAAFALESYKVALDLQESRENFVFSPVSISIALGMILEGAKGACRDQLKGKIAASVPQDQISAAYGWLMGELNKDGTLYQLHSANALFIQEGTELLPKFLVQVSDSFRGQAELKDFQNRAEEARRDINAWVEGKTNNKIKDLLPPRSVDMALLVLVNAIYFKAKWQSPFIWGAETYDAPFYSLGNANSRNVKMMEQTFSFQYHEETELQVVGLPYEQEELTMFIILPKERNGLPDLERSLTRQRLLSLVDSTQRQQVQLSMPKFNMTKDLRLKKVLQNMGITDIFNSAADLSGINGNKDLSISGAFHKAFIEVNEEGTEAAAATAVMLAGSSLFPPKIYVFKADHPFLFFIQHGSSKAILFLGSVIKL